MLNPIIDRKPSAMKYYISLLLCIITLQISAQQVSSEALKAFEAKTYSYKGKELPYRILYPENFDTSKKYPLHLFLHGAGERGSDNQAQLVHGSDLFVKMNEQYPAVVIFPQCPKGDYWADVEVTRGENQNVFKYPASPTPTWAMQAVTTLLEETLEESYIDHNRIYLGGLSMGGMGTYELLASKPDTFAAATAICGGGYPANTARWAQQTPVWIFHGEVDAVVPVIYSQLMVESLLQNGQTPRFSLYPNVNHDSWTNAFNEPDFFSWVYGHTKETGDPADTPEVITEDCTPEWLKFSESSLLTKFEQDNERLKTTNNSQRIVFMGDSITEGWSSTSPEFWEENPHYINRGVGGQTTSQMLLRFRKDVINLTPKKVVILAGTNDIAGNTGITSNQTIYDNIITMAELATVHNIDVVLSSILPVYDYPWKTGLQPATKITELNTLLKDYALKNDHTYIDYHSVMRDAQNGMQSLLTYDGVHCNKAGYEVMEKVLSSAL